MKKMENLGPGIAFGVGGLVAKLCQILASPWTVACQAPLSMGFFRQECWTVLFLTQGKKVSPEGLTVMVNGKYGTFCTTSAVLTMKCIGQKVNAYDSVIEFMKYS